MESNQEDESNCPNEQLNRGGEEEEGNKNESISPPPISLSKRMNNLLRNTIVEGNDTILENLLTEFPYLIEEVIESSVGGNYPIHWAAVALNSSSTTEDKSMIFVIYIYIYIY